MTKKEKLVAYNRALHKAHLLNGLYDADKNFRRSIGTLPNASAMIIFAEHQKRVQGRGCPADCDEVTERLGNESA